MAEAKYELGFQFFKGILYEQNKKLLENIAKDYKVPQEQLMERYLQREYYLPIVQKTQATPPPRHARNRKTK